MTLPRIKICCISTPQEATLAIRHGAAALGLVSAMPSGPGVIDEARIAAMIEASKEGAPEEKNMTRLADDPIAPAINYDEFSKIDLRIAKVVEAAKVDGADKLLRLRLDLGGEERTVFAGIKSAYAAETLVGRLIVVVANLQPRKMKFGTSEGMAVAAGPGGSDIFLLAPDSGAVPGQRVH